MSEGDSSSDTKSSTHTFLNQIRPEEQELASKLFPNKKAFTRLLSDSIRGSLYRKIVENRELPPTKASALCDSLLEQLFPHIFSTNYAPSLLNHLHNTSFPQPESTHPSSSQPHSSRLNSTNATHPKKSHHQPSSSPSHTTPYVYETSTTAEDIQRLEVIFTERIIELIDYRIYQLFRPSVHDLPSGTNRIPMTEEAGLTALERDEEDERTFESIPGKKRVVPKHHNPQSSMSIIDEERRESLMDFFSLMYFHTKSKETVSEAAQSKNGIVRQQTIQVSAKRSHRKGEKSRTQRNKSKKKTRHKKPQTIPDVPPKKENNKSFDESPFGQQDGHQDISQNEEMIHSESSFTIDSNGDLVLRDERRKRKERSELHLNEMTIDELDAELAALEADYEKPPSDFDPFEIDDPVGNITPLDDPTLFPPSFKSPFSEASLSDTQQPETPRQHDNDNTIKTFSSETEQLLLTPDSTGSPDQVRDSTMDKVVFEVDSLQSQQSLTINSPQRGRHPPVTSPLSHSTLTDTSHNSSDDDTESSNSSSSSPITIPSNPNPYSFFSIPPNTPLETFLVGGEEWILQNRRKNTVRQTIINSVQAGVDEATTVALRQLLALNRQSFAELDAKMNTFAHTLATGGFPVVQARPLGRPLPRSHKSAEAADTDELGEPPLTPHSQATFSTYRTFPSEMEYDGLSQIAPSMFSYGGVVPMKVRRATYVHPDAFKHDFVEAGQIYQESEMPEYEADTDMQEFVLPKQETSQAYMKNHPILTSAASNVMFAHPPLAQQQPPHTPIHSGKPQHSTISLAPQLHPAHITRTNSPALTFTDMNMEYPPQIQNPTSSRRYRGLKIQTNQRYPLTNKASLMPITPPEMQTLHLTHVMPIPHTTNLTRTTFFPSPDKEYSALPSERGSARTKGSRSPHNSPFQESPKISKHGSPLAKNHIDKSTSEISSPYSIMSPLTTGNSPGMVKTTPLSMSPRSARHHRRVQQTPGSGKSLRQGKISHERQRSMSLQTTPPFTYDELKNTTKSFSPHTPGLFQYSSTSTVGSSPLGNEDSKASSDDTQLSTEQIVLAMHQETLHTPPATPNDPESSRVLSTFPSVTLPKATNMPHPLPPALPHTPTRPQSTPARGSEESRTDPSGVEDSNQSQSTQPAAKSGASTPPFPSAVVLSGDQSVSTFPFPSPDPTQTTFIERPFGSGTTSPQEFTPTIQKSIYSTTFGTSSQPHLSTSTPTLPKIQSFDFETEEGPPTTPNISSARQMGSSQSMQAIGIISVIDDKDSDDQKRPTQSKEEKEAIEASFVNSDGIIVVSSTEDEDEDLFEHQLDSDPNVDKSHGVSSESFFHGSTSNGSELVQRESMWVFGSPSREGLVQNRTTMEGVQENRVNTPDESQVRQKELRTHKSECVDTNHSKAEKKQRRESYPHVRHDPRATLSASQLVTQQRHTHKQRIDFTHRNSDSQLLLDQSNGMLFMLSNNRQSLSPIGVVSPLSNSPSRMEPDQTDQRPLRARSHQVQCPTNPKARKSIGSIESQLGNRESAMKVRRFSHQQSSTTSPPQIQSKDAEKGLFDQAGHPLTVGALLSMGQLDKARRVSTTHTRAPAIPASSPHSPQDETPAEHHTRTVSSGNGQK